MLAPIDTGLSDQVMAQLQAVFARCSAVQAVILYGSRAKGNYRNSSDIDLCLQAPALTYAELLGLETELDELLLPYTIDLCCWHQLENEALKAHIQRVGLTIYTQDLV